MSNTPSDPIPANDFSRDPSDGEGEGDFARRIVVGHSADDAAEKCAAYLAQCIRERAQTSATVTVAFSGGSTPIFLTERGLRSTSLRRTR